MTSKWHEYREKNGITPLEALNPKTRKVDELTAHSRYSTCIECPELTPITKQCVQCGCFMVLKTKFESAKCPIGKW